MINQFDTRYPNPHLNSQLGDPLSRFPCLWEEVNAAPEYVILTRSVHQRGVLPLSVDQRAIFTWSNTNVLAFLKL